MLKIAHHHHIIAKRFSNELNIFLRVGNIRQTSMIVKHGTEAGTTGTSLQVAAVVVETTSETNVVVITITGRHHRLNKNNVSLLTVQVIHLKTLLICTTEMQSTGGTGGITEVPPVDEDEHRVVVTEEEITISSTGMVGVDTMSTETVVVMMITMVARDHLLR